jgi:hypothetical protein
MISNLPIIDVDFNDVYEDDSLVVLRGSSFNTRMRGPRRGNLVLLWDPESGTCIAQVERVRGRRLTLTVNWESWEPVPNVDFPVQWASQAFVVQSAIPDLPRGRISVSFA